MTDTQTNITFIVLEFLKKIDLTSNLESINLQHN